MISQVLKKRMKVKNTIYRHVASSLSHKIHFDLALIFEQNIGCVLEIKAVQSQKQTFATLKSPYPYLLPIIHKDYIFLLWVA